MLAIASDILPTTPLAYLAFRVAFMETIEQIALHEQIDGESEIFGYLTEVPFLRSVPPHIQLDLLSETWVKHAHPEQVFAGDLLDESVVYAVCEFAAQIAETEPTVITHHMISGPQHAQFKVTGLLPSELRNLHLSLANEGDFLLISQFEDLTPDESRELKHQFGLDEECLEVMFDVLGRWRLSLGFLDNLSGLISPRELSRTADLLANHMAYPAK
ncbi:MAG: hypothetical protein CMJ78_19425 [Planctomycetaceae bacterium]|nr:hypothetical protein [Planctomycetaceae bacterium]